MRTMFGVAWRVALLLVIGLGSGWLVWRVFHRATPLDPTAAILAKIDSATAAAYRAGAATAHADTVRLVERTEYRTLRDSILHHTIEDPVPVTRLAAACDSTIAADSTAIAARDTSIAEQARTLVSLRASIAGIRPVSASVPRLGAELGGGYDLLQGAPMLDAGAHLRLVGRWQLVGRLSTLLSPPRADNGRASGTVALHYTF